MAAKLTARSARPRGAGARQGAAFVADLYIINTPSRLRLTVAAGRVEATWNVVPLVGSDLLRQLRSPLMTRLDVA